MSMIRKKALESITVAGIEEIKNKKLNKPLTLLDHIDKIINIHFSIQNYLADKEKIAKCQKTLNRHLTVCSDILGITTLQALLFSYILNSNDPIKLKNLAKFLKVTKVHCLKYLDDLDVLINKRLIRKSDRGSESDFNYWVPSEVIQALREGKVFTPPRLFGLSKDEFFEYLIWLFKRYYKKQKITKKFS